MITQHICNLCTSDRNYTLFYKWNYPIVKCKNCGFIETIVPGDLNLSSIYDKSYYDGGQKDGYVDYEASKEILVKEFEDLLLHVDNFTPAHGTLVELGCAYGFLLEKAQKFYNKAIGFEISTPSIEYCLDRGLNVHSTSKLHELLPKISPIDVLVMLDTIEHVEQPKELLSSLFTHMNNGGILVLTTGDIASIYSRLTGKHWRLMTPPQHLSFFSVATMCKMLIDIGFEIVSTDKPWKKVPIKLVMYQLFSRLGVKNLALIEKLPNIGIPVNLFDAMRVVAKKP